MAMPRRVSRVLTTDLETGETPLAGLMVVTWPLFTWGFLVVAIAIVVVCLVLGTLLRTLLVALSVEIIIGAVTAGLQVRERTELGSLFAGLVVTDRRLLGYPTTTQLGVIQPLRLEARIDEIESVSISPQVLFMPRRIDIAIDGHRPLSVTSRFLGRPGEFVAAIRSAIQR